MYLCRQQPSTDIKLSLWVLLHHSAHLSWVRMSSIYRFESDSFSRWVSDREGEHMERLRKNKPYSLMNLRQGTEFLMQVPVRRSTFSTMTKGFSSRVTMDRWLSSVSASPKELKRGHTGYFKVKLWFSHLPIWKWIEKMSVTFLLNSLLALLF